MLRKDCNKKGFTLVELLIVIVIVAVLVTIGILVLSGKKEKSANATDAYNAKTIAHQIEYYYMSNPEAVNRLLAIEPDSPGAMEVLVLKDGIIFSTHRNGGKGCNTAKDKAVEADMIKIFGNYDKTVGGYSYNTSIKCQSTKTWKQYAVVISMWNPNTRKATSYPNIFYTSYSEEAYDGGYKWDSVMSNDSYNKTFKKLCGGDRIFE